MYTPKPYPQRLNKIFFCLILMTTFITITVRAQEVVHDANAEERQVGAFTAIDVSNAFDVQLSQSNEDAVAVSAARTEFRDRIRTEVRDGVLKIWYDDARGFRTGNKQLKAYISFRKLDRIRASGACDVNISGKIKTDNLDIRLSGASDLRGAVESGSLQLDMSGASDVRIAGSATDLKIKANGASQVKGFDLVTETCTINATGASDIRITVNKELSAYASGATGIYYRGSGVIKDVKSSGASNISRRD